MNQELTRATARRFRRVAHHEAGHAVMAHMLGVPFDTASIEPDGDSAGCVTLSDLRWIARSKPPDPRLRFWVERSVMSHMAGVLAEQALTRRNNWAGASSDLANTLEMAGVVSFTNDERDQYLDWLFARTRFLMTRRAVRRAVAAVARELVHCRTLSSRAIAITANRAWGRRKSDRSGHASRTAHSIRTGARPTCSPSAHSRRVGGTAASPRASGQR